MKNENLLIYCIGSIPVDSAQIFLYDFLSDKKQAFSIREKEIVKKLKDNQEISNKKTDHLNIISFADGAYPCYVAIDNTKKVRKIFFEINNSCGWGSNMFHPDVRKSRIEHERKLRAQFDTAFVENDMQLDMPVSARIGVDFQTRHRKTYTPWNWFNQINEPLFSKQKNAIRSKLCELKIKSKFIVHDDFGEIEHKKKEYQKVSKLKNFYPDEKVYFPVKNKTYPVYVHHIFKNEKELQKDLDDENLGYENSNPIYPIICIEEIEDCYLSKDKDCKLFFQRKNKANISENLINQIKIKPKELKICPLDSDNLSSLKCLDNLIWKIDTIELWNFNEVTDWTNLKKLIHVKCIKFMNCDLKTNDMGPKTWAYMMAKMQIVRKNDSSINAAYGNLTINVNGKEIDLTTFLDE